MKTVRVSLSKKPPPSSLGKHTKGILKLCQPTGDNPAPSYIKNSLPPALTHIYGIYWAHTMYQAWCPHIKSLCRRYQVAAIKESHTSWVLEQVTKLPGPLFDHVLTEG